MSNTALDEIRLRRSLVLQVLHGQYPYPLVRTALERGVIDYYARDTRALERDLEYLAKKGYLEARSDDVLPGRVVHSYQLTPSGVDLVEGATQDPGILFVQGR